MVLQKYAWHFDPNIDNIDMNVGIEISGIIFILHLYLDIVFVYIDYSVATAGLPIKLESQPRLMK